MYNVPSTTVQCFYSTVRNIGDRAAYFGFLPPHGRRLDAGEELLVFGHIFDYFTGQPTQDRHRRAFEAAVGGADPVLVLESGPAHFLYDATRDATKVIKLDDGTLTVEDPCTGAYSSVEI